MDYRKSIVRLARQKETVRAFAFRAAKSNNIVNAGVVVGFWPFTEKQESPTEPENKTDPNKSFFVFTFDKDTDIMHVSKEGREVVSFKGHDAWGDALNYFKRLFVNKQLDPKSTHFLYTGKKGLVDISNDFAMAGSR